MKRLKLKIALMFAVICALTANAVSAEDDLLTTLRGSLVNAKNSADSLKILSDLYDASPQKNRKDIGWEIIEIANRANNQNVLIEFLPQVAMLNIKDEAKLRKLLVITEKVNDTEHRKSIKLFINVTATLNQANYATDEERRQSIRKFAKAEMNSSGDRYQDLLDLARLVMFMGQTSKSSLYLEYLDRAEKLIDQLPPDCYYIRNLFYTTSANLHTQSGNHQLALEKDRKLLEVIKNLEEKYRKAGRKYRNYDRYYYQCYRRMLSNYPALTFDEVKELYTRLAMIADRNEECHRDFYEKKRPTAYRLMAEKKYDEAIPVLKKALPLYDDRNVRRKLLSMLSEAADSVGDEETLVPVLKEYNKVLQQTLEFQTEQAYKEMQIRYDVNRLRDENQTLEISKKNTELATKQKLVSLILLALLVMTLVVMWLYRRHFAMHQKNRDLNKENGNLRKQLNELINKGKGPAGSTELPRKSDSNPQSPSNQ